MSRTSLAEMTGRSGLEGLSVAVSAWWRYGYQSTFRPEHNWCGLEWAAVEHLTSRRLRDRPFKSIILVMVRQSEPLPQAVSAIQYIDFSRLTLIGPRYFTVRDFRVKVNEI